MNKNQLKLNITLTFTEDAIVTEKDKQEIIDNVLSALRSQVYNGLGLAPNRGDYITDIIEVTDKKGSGIVWDMKEDVQI